MTATSTAASSLPPVRTAYHVPLSLMASISEETISLWLKLGALEKLEQAVLDGYGDQLCGKTSRIPQVNKFLRQIPLFQNKIKEIHRAVSDGKVRDVQHLIDRKKLAFCRDATGATPLHKAVIFGHQDIIDYLVDRYPGVIHVRDHQGRTPLHYAAFLPDGGEIYQFLLSAGADERALDVYGRQPSYYIDAQNENILKQLREANSLNGIRKIRPKYYAQNTGNRTPGGSNIGKPVLSKLQIREMISEGNIESLEELVLQGHGDRLLGEISKDPRIQAFLHIVPIYMERIYDVHRAVMRDQLEHVVILLENRRLAMARDQLGATPLHKAVWFGHYKIAHYVSHHFPETINTLDLEGRTPLHYAAALRDNKHMYGILIEAGANKGILDNKGKTADYYLQYPEHLNLDEVIKKCHKVNATYLANTTNRIKGKSPVRQSPPPSNDTSSSPRSDDNDISSKDSGHSMENGVEPDYMLAMLQKDNLAKRLDMNSANIRRWYVERDMEKIERAIMEGYGDRVVRLQGDVDTSSKDQTEEEEEDEEEDQKEKEVEDLSGKVTEMVERIHAIHIAVSNDDLSELQSHLHEKDYALAKDHMGMTPLHRAVLLGRTNILKFLIEKFPEAINAKNKEGRTALHYAAAMSKKDGQTIFKLLLQAGADPKARDNHGRTPDYYRTHLMTMPNKAPVKARASNHTLTRHTEPLNRYSKQGVLERMTAALQRGDVDLLQDLVLEGHGRHLLGKASWNDDVKQFLKGLPNYLASIQAIHDAVKENDISSVENLIQRNNKLLRARDENGSTPVHVAAATGRTNILQYLTRNYPAVLSCKDAAGRTALHIVCQNGNLELSKMLRDAGADPKILDQKGRTADYYLQSQRFDPLPFRAHNGITDPVIVSSMPSQRSYSQSPKKTLKSHSIKKNMASNRTRLEKTSRKTSSSDAEKLIATAGTAAVVGSVASNSGHITGTAISELRKESLNQGHETEEKRPQTDSELDNKDSALEDKEKDTESKTPSRAETSISPVKDETADTEVDETSEEKHEGIETEDKGDTDTREEPEAETQGVETVNVTDEQEEGEATDDVDLKDESHVLQDAAAASEGTEEKEQEADSNEQAAEEEVNEDETEKGDNEVDADDKADNEDEDDTTADAEVVDESAKEEKESDDLDNAQDGAADAEGETEETGKNIDESVKESEELKKEDDHGNAGSPDEIANESETKDEDREAESATNVEGEVTDGAETREEEPENASAQEGDAGKEEAVEEAETADGNKESDEVVDEDKPKTADHETNNDEDTHEEQGSRNETAPPDNDIKSESPANVAAEGKTSPEGDNAADNDKNDETAAEEKTESEDGKTMEEEATEGGSEDPADITKWAETDTSEKKEEDEDKQTAGTSNEENNVEESGDSEQKEVEEKDDKRGSVSENQDGEQKEVEEKDDKRGSVSENQDGEQKLEDKEEIPNELSENQDQTPAPEMGANLAPETAAEDAEKDSTLAEPEEGIKEEDKGDSKDPAADETDGNQEEVQNNDDSSEKLPESEGPKEAEDTKAQESEESKTPHQSKDHLDELIEHWIRDGDLLRLEHVVLAGQGDRLIERTSDDKQVQDFLDLVPIYMAKIRAVHEAVVKGQLREVRTVLTRKRFALSRDQMGASPLHLAVLHGHTDVATYIISHFPETMDGPDNEGRTPFHYATTLKDDAALYRILKAAGADENIEDKSGHSPKYYLTHHGELTTEMLLEPYRTRDDDQ